VDVDEVGALRLLRVGDEARFPRLRVDLGALGPDLERRRDQHDLVEPLLAAHLVQQGHLGHGDLRRVRQPPQLLAPVEVLLGDPRVEQALQPFELLAVAEDAFGDRAAVDLADVVEDPPAEPLDQLPAHVLVLAQEPVNDLVARHGGGAVAPERVEGLALPRSDAARDGDGDGRGHYSGDAGGSPSEAPGPGSSGAASSASLARGRGSVGGDWWAWMSASGCSGGSSSTTEASGGAPSGNTSSERSRSGVPSIGSESSARWVTPPPSTRFSESESRRRSASTSMIFAWTRSPCETTSRGFSTWCCASSEMCTSPSTPGRISTKAPNVTTLVTLPSTVSPSLYVSSTCCHGSDCVCLRPSEMRWRSRSMSSTLTLTSWPISSTS